MPTTRLDGTVARATAAACSGVTVTEPSSASVLVPEGWVGAVVDAVAVAPVGGVVPDSELSASCTAGVTVASGALVPQAVSTPVRPTVQASRKAARRRLVVMAFIVYPFRPPTSSGRLSALVLIVRQAC